ncbi:DNA-binding protein, excisionase family [Frankia sp. CeD]|nr:DNA-binding protein, excisionase family [Frankia sp. CeD]
MDRLLSIVEASEVLGTGERFVRRLVAERRIPYHHVGKYVRFRLSDVEAFVSAGRVEALR